MADSSPSAGFRNKQGYLFSLPSGEKGFYICSVGDWRWFELQGTLGVEYARVPTTAHCSTDGQVVPRSSSLLIVPRRSSERWRWSERWRLVRDGNP